MFPADVKGCPAAGADVVRLVHGARLDAAVGAALQGSLRIRESAFIMTGLDHFGPFIESRDYSHFQVKLISPIKNTGAAL